MRNHADGKLWHACKSADVPWASELPRQLAPLPAATAGMPLADCLEEALPEQQEALF